MAMMVAPLIVLLIALLIVMLAVLLIVMLTVLLIALLVVLPLLCSLPYSRLYARGFIVLLFALLSVMPPTFPWL